MTSNSEVCTCDIHDCIFDLESDPCPRCEPCPYCRAIMESQRLAYARLQEEKSKLVKEELRYIDEKGIWKRAQREYLEAESRWKAEEKRYLEILQRRKTATE